MGHSFLLAAAAASALWAATADAQASGWATDQINATMCYWEQPRAAVVRDTLYIDGGNLWWIPGMSDGSYGAVTDDGNPLGIIYSLNFSVPFNTARDNITSLMGNLTKAPNGGAATNFGPNYLDGAMLANDAEFFLYGGLYRETDAYTEPDGREVLGYEADQYGVDKPSWRATFVNDELPSNMSRYLAYGGAASVPSENKAYYFSGLHAPGWAPIYTVTGNDSETAVNVSNTLLTLDMTTQQSETWTNQSVPTSVGGRANPELVWVPVGEQGVLVAIGGVVYPEFVTVTHQSENEAASRRTSPGFLSSVDVYDIANKTWYKQPTAGTPPGGSGAQLTRGCAVLATAADRSSYNIYWYGGYDGLDATAAFVDDVYVLSLPSFTWIQVSTGTTAHARAGHKCVTPYPDQMFVVGGATNMSGIAPACVGGGILQVYNLSSAAWITDYDPRVWSNYTVPSAVVKSIGGNGRGSATATAPAATSGWVDDGLKAVFSSAYPTSKITNYYPYAVSAAANSSANSSANGTNPDAPATTSKSGGSHVPSYLPPLLGVILGLMFVTACCVGFLLWRRRRLLFKNGRRSSGAASGGARGLGGGLGGVGATESDASTYDTGRNFVFSWLRAQPSVKQTSTIGTSSYEDPPSGHPNAVSTNNQSSPVSPEMDQLPGTPRHLFGAAALAGAGGAAAAGAAHHSPHSSQHSHPVEVANTFIAEMPDTSHPAELQDTGLSPTDIVERHSRLGSKHRRFFGSGGSFSYIGGATTVHGGRGSVSSDKASGGPGANSSYMSYASSTAELDSNGVSNSGSGSASRTTASSGPAAGGTQSRAAEVTRPDSPPLGTAAAVAAAGAAVAGGVAAAAKGAAAPATTAAAPAGSGVPAHTSGVSDLSEVDKAHLRKTSEGASSIASSGVSALVSPIGGAFPLSDDAGASTAAGGASAGTASTAGSGPAGPVAGRPTPIPEAEAGAEAEAEAAAERHATQSQPVSRQAAERPSVASLVTHTTPTQSGPASDVFASAVSLQPPSPPGRPRTASSGSGPRKSVFKESQEDMSA